MCGGTGGCGGCGSGCGGSAAVMAAGSDAAAADYAWLYDDEGGAPEPAAAVSQPRLELEVSWGGFVAVAILVALLVALPGLIRSMR